MVCDLPSPIWANPLRAGLQSSAEDAILSSIVLTWGLARAPTFLFYNIYYSSSISTLFDAPKAFSSGLTATIPTALAPVGDFYAVRASTLGITTAAFDTLLNMEVSNTAFAYPDSVLTTVVVNSDDVVTHIPVDGYSQFPATDGYLQIGSEVMFYSSIDGYAGGSFVIGDQDPFGCNDGYLYNVGTEVQLFKGFEEGNTVSFISAESCILEPPVWGNLARPGLEEAADLGIGTVVQLTWGPAIAPAGASTVHYNVYYSQTFNDLFEAPQAITLEQVVLVPDLNPGEIYYFGVKASYYTTDVSFDITQMTQISENLFAYPQETVVAGGTYPATGLAILTVNSTTGFPDSGFVIVDFEILEYDGITGTSFNVTQRDVFSLGEADFHTDDTSVKLFKGIEDSNITNFRAVPSWDARLDTARLPVDGYEPAYLQDSDGYRDFPVDNNTEDHQEQETENDDRPEFPFCGYRATNFVDLYSGNFCGTYFGGRQSGFGGGINIGDVNLQREELLLGLTGEPFTLLRKKWTGKVCPDVTHRQEQPTARCPGCFGTTFVGGFDRYFHPRAIRPGVDNPNGLILLRVAPYNNDLDRTPERGLEQIDQIQVWGSAVPTIKDRDMLVRYIVDDHFNIIGEEFRYEVLVVNRNNILFGLDGRQQITIKKLVKTHIIYTYPVPLL